MSSIKVPDTITKLSPDDDYSVVNGEDVKGFTELKTLVTTHNDKISKNITKIEELEKKGKTFTYAGSTAPTYDTEPHGNYLLVFRAMQSTLNVQTPSPTGSIPDGAIFTIYNDDSNDNIRLTIGNPSDKFKSGSTAYNIPAENFISFVYILSSRSFEELESGYIPAARINIANYVENKLNSDGKLHTFADIESEGFLKGIKVSGKNLSTVNSAKWLHIPNATVSEQKPGQAQIDITTSTDADPTEYMLHFQTIASRNIWSAANGSKYTEVVCVVDRDDNGYVSYYEWNGSKWVDYNASGVIMSDSNGAIPKNIKTVVYGPGFSIQQAGDQEDAALVTYTEQGISNGITVNQIGGQGNKVETIDVYPPLETYADPDKTKTARLLIKPGTFEKNLSPSFLAYLTENEDIVGKMPQGKETDPGAHHNGVVWFDDIVVPTGAYIQNSRANKTYGIQEADELDPNVSGGTDYLIAARIHMKGKAPSDGFVRLYLWNNSIDPLEPKGYLEDKNSHPMAVQRQYRADEELGVLDLIGIVNAKGLQQFTVHVVDNMTNDVIELTDRTEGASGIMIQALKSDFKTGLGLLQFESDTNQNIEFSSHYLGADRMTIGYITSRNEPVVSYTAGTNFVSVDGLNLQNRKGIKLGVVGNKMVIQDDGVHMTDFNFGKTFSAEETRMLHSKIVTVTTTTTTKESAARVYAVKWTGKPDQFTNGIISSWSNMNPVFESNWALIDSFEIVENLGAEDVVTTKDFTIPVDANNYAIILTTNSGEISPYHIEIKAFNVSVKAPFIGYALDAPELHNESHLEYSDSYKQLVQDTQGYAELRYTINNSPEGNPMPVGEIKKGSAPITLDPSVNQVAGSSAKGGEGAIVFGDDGNAHISTMLRLWNEQISASTTEFWWSTVDEDGVLTKLPDSVFTVTVPAGAKGVMYRMVYDHDFEKDQKIALRAKTDSIDGAFLQSIPGKPMLNTNIKFERLATTESGDDPWQDLDVSQFDKVFNNSLTCIKSSFGKASETFRIHLPQDASLAVLDAVKQLADGSVRPVAKLDWTYDNDTEDLTVSFGEVPLAALITIGIYI